MSNKILLTKKELYKVVEESVTKILKEVRETTAYHGSNAEFDEFDLAYVNTGAKGQAHGYGVYLTLTKSGTQYYGNNTYTVEIPSERNKYLYAEKVYGKTFLNKIMTKVYRLLLKQDDTYVGAEMDLMQDLRDSFDDLDGTHLMGTLDSFLGGDKAASEFMYSLGFIGIKYRVGEFENVVMFNPKDIKVVNKDIQKIR